MTTVDAMYDAKAVTAHSEHDDSDRHESADKHPKPNVRLFPHQSALAFCALMRSRATKAATVSFTCLRASSARSGRNLRTTSSTARSVASGGFNEAVAGFNFSSI